MNAMSELPPEIVRAKVGVVSAFAQTLRSYASLNHLAQATRAVLQNTSQINQMLGDLNRVDFTNVQEQASWVCQCEEGMVQKLEQACKLTLQQQSSLDQWASWLDNVVTHVLKHHEGTPSFPKAARQVLLKWSFYSSMAIRDLTLRSAASFGSFHLICLLCDESVFYLVEHRVAQATGETPTAGMGEFGDLTPLSPTPLDKEDMSDLGSEVDTASRSMGGALVKHCDGGSGGAELVELLPQQGFILPFCVLGVWADADYRAEISLQSSSPFWRVCFPTQLAVISKLHQATLDAVIQIAYKDVE
ncbi:DNA-binding protein RFX2-like [Phalacrocorax carbo]|uniref:DNA-binding protein RFX2-like n=1 Tax=Phalacrocorax carbo TaxID=9209 RepID=UPI003119E05A